MTIKEVEQYLQVPRATVRYYEKEGLVSPERSGNGYREYSAEDVERLRKIIVFRKLGMSITNIEDVLDGVKPLSEAVTENIANLEKQIEELKGALFVCHKLQEEKEEIETFEVDKYWNVITEEEKKGNSFLDIAKDMVRYEKSIILEYFGIADVEGDLSVSIPRAILAVVVCASVFGIVTCITNGAWTLQNIVTGIKRMLCMVLLEIIVGIPVFFIGRKRPDMLKNRKIIMFWICMGLLMLLVLLIALSQVFGW